MRTLAFALGVAALLSTVCLAGEKDKHEAEREYTRPFPMVATRQDASDDVKSAGSEIADAIGVKGFIEGKVNPVCCVWIEISRWTPNPGTPGYIIVNQPGGSIITASDAEQLQLAVKRFKKSIRTKDGNVEVPIGVLTNYPVVADR